MKRDFGALDGGPFDLLVVGGGVYGAWTAYDAALRGLRVALVEKDDWAAGTSSASSKLIHGGLRYLEYGWFGLVRDALEERSRLWRLAPHRVWPLRFLMPVYADSRVGRLRLKAGLWLYERLSGSRRAVARHEFLDRGQVVERYPFLEADGLTGGFGFGDGQTDDARLTLEIVDGAHAAGAVVVNRATADVLRREGDRVCGALVRDEVSGESVEVRAEVTVNCAGPWAMQLLGPARASAPGMRLSRGVHLVLPALPTDDALILLGRHSGRVLFVLPWYGKSLVGTTDTDYTGDPDRVAVEQADVESLLGQASRVLGEGRWTAGDVVGSFAGLRALPVGRSTRSADVTRKVAIEEPHRGLLMPTGGKLTSARPDAALLVERVMSLLGRKDPGCPTADRPFPWAPTGPFAEWEAAALARGKKAGLDPETAAGCALRYGRRFDPLLARIAVCPELAERICPGEPFCLAEVAHAAEHEMALELSDILRRRTPLQLLTPLTAAERRRAARVAGDVLGWSEERVDRETAAAR